MNKRTIGTQREHIAEQYLCMQGYRILHRNFRCRNGEIDLVAWDHGTLAFVEVKYRSSLSCGYPQEAVDRRKQIRICRCADYYRIRYPAYGKAPVRFDVAAILGNRIMLCRNAFPYLSGNGR